MSLFSLVKNKNYQMITNIRYEVNDKNSKVVFCLKYNLGYLTKGLRKGVSVFYNLYVFELMINNKIFFSKKFSSPYFAIEIQYDYKRSCHMKFM